MKKAFIDSYVLLDVALGREPFFTASRGMLAVAENDLIIGNISSNCVANVYYILRKIGGGPNARKFISTLVNYISVIPIDHQNVVEALASHFSDFEDALQNCSASEHRCEYIITMNIDDYKNSKLIVMLPEEFIRLFL